MAIEIKGIQIGKEEIKLWLFADDIVLYIENSKDSTKKLLEIINEFSKIVGQKVNIQKSAAFYMLIMSYQKEKLREQSSFKITQKTIIHWWKIEEHKNKWKDILCLWIGRINIVKKAIVHKAIYRGNVDLVKIPAVFFIEMGQTILKIA